LRERVTGDLMKGWSPEEIAGRLCYERYRGRKKNPGARITGMRSIDDRPAEVAGR
jgi:hypothetical protein